MEKTELNEQERQKRLQELKERAADYVSDKATEGTLKKRLDNNNTTIKVLMELLGENEIDTGTGKIVVYSISETPSTNEEMLIATLKKCVPNTQCIKTKVVEYIDEDVLESEIYKDVEHKIFTEEVMAELGKCTTIKETPKLTIKKAGKKDDDNDK